MLRSRFRVSEKTQHTGWKISEEHVLHDRYFEHKIHLVLGGQSADLNADGHEVGPRRIRERAIVDLAAVSL